MLIHSRPIPLGAQFALADDPSDSLHIGLSLFPGNIDRQFSGPFP